MDGVIEKGIVNAFLYLFRLHHKLPEITRMDHLEGAFGVCFGPGGRGFGGTFPPFHFVAEKLSSAGINLTRS